MNRQLNSEERKYVLNGACPHCKAKTLVDGPQGGWCLNLRCETCSIRLNVGLFAEPATTFMEITQEPPGYVVPQPPPAPPKPWWQFWKKAA